MAEVQLIEYDLLPILSISMPAAHVRKVVKKNAGSGFAENPPMLEKIPGLSSRRLASGHGKNQGRLEPPDYHAIEVTKRLEQTGIKALTIHPRLAVDGFRYPADWSIIAAVKSIAQIPIIGNGDINTPASALRMFKETGCDAVMIGRGALDNPWIFQQVADLMAKREMTTNDSPLERVKLCRRQLEMEISYRGEKVAHKEMKKFYRWYLRGFGHVAAIREKLVRSKSVAEALSVLDELARSIQ
jgi:tRNA-dihydrouridine synthase B